MPKMIPVDMLMPQPFVRHRMIDGVSMAPALAGKPVELNVPMFWRTHVSPPDQRVPCESVIGGLSVTKH